MVDGFNPGTLSGKRKAGAVVRALARTQAATFRFPIPTKAPWESQKVSLHICEMGIIATVFEGSV